MRSFLTGRWTPAAIVAPAMLLLGGGAYAIAAGGGKKISACVHHKGGGLYVGKCARHDKKLIWNVAGLPGTPGHNGQPGGPGPQGPGATTLIFDGTASATPTRQTLGTVIGVTISADCLQPAAGKAQLRVYIQTSDGSWNIDFDGVSDNNGTVADFTASITVPPGTFTTPFNIDTTTAGAAPYTYNRQLNLIQLGPQKGSMVWHEATNATPTSQTCHLSVQAFPSA